MIAIVTAPTRLVKPKSLVKKEKKITADEFYLITPPDNATYELHNGKIISMPSPLLPHQKLSANLHYELMHFVKKSKLGLVLAAPIDVEFDNLDVMQPDLLFISNERMTIIENNRKIKGAPDLVVEILLDGNSPKEMNYKKFVFENNEVSEYWLVNLAKKTLIQYENTDIGFVPVAKLTESDTIKSIVLKGFELQIGEIFE
jgi:Uma2 family endonuclease